MERCQVRVWSLRFCASGHKGSVGRCGDSGAGPGGADTEESGPSAAPGGCDLVQAGDLPSLHPSGEITEAALRGSLCDGLRAVPALMEGDPGSCCTSAIPAPQGSVLSYGVATMTPRARQQRTGRREWGRRLHQATPERDSHRAIPRPIHVRH